MGRWTDLAVWRGPTVNCGDGDQYPNEGEDRMREHRGLVEHTAVGSFEGTISWCRNPDSRRSAHFVVGFDGRIAQLVDTDIAAWTQRDGNGHWLSVENEGEPRLPLTAAQIEANARLFARGHLEYGWPLQEATSPDGRGLGHHSMGAESGADWGHSECPGVLIKAQKPLIVARAIDIIRGEDMTPEEQKRLAAAEARVNAVIAGQAELTTSWSSKNPTGVQQLPLVQRVEALEKLVDELTAGGLVAHIHPATIGSAVAQEGP